MQGYGRMGTSSGYIFRIYHFAKGSNSKAVFLFRYQQAQTL
jgi:hypothetical protein